VATCLGLNQSIIGPLQGTVPGIMQLCVKHVVITMLSRGIPHYQTIRIIKLTHTRGADKSLARPGRKKANVSVRMA